MKMAKKPAAQNECEVEEKFEFHGQLFYMVRLQLCQTVD
jgi:hypothetical protein